MTPERAEYLAELTRNNGAFSNQFPGLQVAWDSTSLGLLKECPRRYYYEIIEGFQRKSNVHLTFGIFLHATLEKYDHLRAEGADHDTATREMLRYALELTGERQVQCFCPACEQTSLNVDVCPYCEHEVEHGDEVFVPWESGDNNKNRFTLIRTIIWYVEHFKDDVFKTVLLANGKPAVELSFQFDIPLHSPEGKPYVLCGHLDRIGEMLDGEWILDRKSSKNTITSSYFEKYSPDNQMSLYQLAGQVVFNRKIKGLIIDAAQVAVNFSRFARGFAGRTQAQLEEWLADAMNFIRQAEIYAMSGYWPMNDKSCSNYGGCPFRQICSRDPKVRDQFLNTMFDRRVWDPTQARGE